MMVVKKRDFQKIAGCLNEFLSKLSCDESTASLRDSINLVLFCMQTYYKKLRSRSLSNIVSPRMTSLAAGLILSGGVSPVSPACGVPDQFEWKWYNLESPRVSASLGTDEFSSLPLIIQAGKSGDKELLMKLLEKDPEAIHQVDGLGRSVVMYTIHGNSVAHMECLEILINMKCDLNIQANDDSTGLHVAAHDTNTSALSLLLKHKALCNIEDNQGRTPLHWAASKPSIDNVKLLLQNGGDLNAKDREGLTAAMWACHFDQPQNLQALQMALSRIDPEEDALLNESDNCGQTAIHWAVRGMGTLECLQALMTDQTALLRDNDGKTVLHTAAEQGNVRACEMILEVTGGTEGLLDTDSSNRTPLHLAAICGQGEVVNFLLDLGADPFMQDAFGASSWDYIQNKQLYYCVMVIRAHPQFRKHLPGKLQQASEPQAQDKQEKQSEVFKSSVCPEIDSTKPGSIHQKSDVSDLHGFDVQNDTGVEDILETNKNNQLNTEETKSKVQEINQSMPEEEQATCLGKSRRQTTLTRQSGFHSESDLKNSQEAASFDLRTEDGSVLVVMSNLSNKDKEEHIDVEDGHVEIVCEDNLEYSSTRLQQGRGSASSVVSEPDNSDNCSVNVGLSVSSLGSDIEEIIHEEDYGDCIMEVDGTNVPEEEECVEEIYPESSKIPTQHPRQTPQSQSSSQEYTPSSRQTKQSSKQQDLAASEISKANVSGAKSEEEIHDVAPKKKKDKSKKKKQKVGTVVELPAPLPPPRGFVAPLHPSIITPPGAFQLGSIDQRGVKPGYWEHSGLGPLRHTRPEPSPPSPRLAKTADFPKGQMQFGDNFPLDPNANDGGFERPVTPEPPRSPRGVSGQQQQLFYPSPPGSAMSASDGSFRGSMEGGLQEREMNYGPSGPSRVTGQALLSSMDTGRDSKMDSWSARNVGQTSKVGMAHGSPGQQTFVLHGPVPHPPHR